MPEKQTIYIIDGHAQIFRAYFAIRGGMTSPNTGEPTHAIFGFAGMLIQLFRDYKPDYVVMAIDTGAKTFRDELYPQYKATRDPAPADLRSQEQRIFEMARLFGIPVLGSDEAEADDVIASLVRLIQKDKKLSDCEVRIISKDKDLEQLITPHVNLFDIHTDTLVDAKALMEKKGITPEQVVDVLALMGDTIDNVPGVEGIGPKTAAKLVIEFGSVDGVLANIDKIKGKRRENIEKARETLALSRQLVTLKDDLSLDFQWEQAKAGPIDTVALKDMFQTLGFRRHSVEIEKLGQDAATNTGVNESEDTGSMKPAASDDGQAFGLFADLASDDAKEQSATAYAPITAPAEADYRAVLTEDDLTALVEQLKNASIVSFDTETIGLGHWQDLCGLCFSVEPGVGYYVPVRSPEQEKHLSAEVVLSRLKSLLEKPSFGIVGHNLKYDLLVMRHAGVKVGNVVFDTMIASHLLGEQAHGLDALAETRLGRKMIPISQLIGEKQRGKPQQTMDKVPLERIVPYAAEDADISLQLYELFKREVDVMGLQELASQVEMPLVEVLADMDHAGIRVDPKVLEEQREALSDRITELRDSVHELVGHPFNLDSPKQLADVLFNEWQLPAIKKTKTGYSTDVEVLEKLADHDDLTAEQAKLPGLVLEYRQLTKLTSTYLVALKEAIRKDTGRVHASFHQTGAATGRLSSSGPNLQNIPIRTDIGRQIRKAFVAEPGQQLICADYSQIELRMLAHLSKDEALSHAFKSGEDIHRSVAAQVFDTPLDQVTRDQRGHAKTINFGIIYGVTPYGLSRRIEGMDVESARTLITDYRKRFPGIDTFLHDCVAQAEMNGYVSTIMGRRRAITEIRSARGNTRSLGERLAINTVVQGSAADLIKLAMVKLHQRIKRENLPMQLLLQIHDELVCECPAEQAEQMSQVVKEEMTQAMQLAVPLEVEISTGDSWFDAK